MNFREGDKVTIHGCNYTVTDSYLSASKASSYPKVLGSILGIKNLNKFVKDLLGYCQYDDRVLSYKNMDDCNTLVTALQSYDGVEVVTSDVLDDRAINKFFKEDNNINNINDLDASVLDTLKGFNAVKIKTAKVINKIQAKQAELMEAIDDQNISKIKSLVKQLPKIIEYVRQDTDLHDILEIGERVLPEDEAFDAESFMND